MFFLFKTIVFVVVVTIGDLSVIDEDDTSNEFVMFRADKQKVIDLCSFVCLFVCNTRSFCFVALFSENSRIARQTRMDAIDSHRCNSRDQFCTAIVERALRFGTCLCLTSPNKTALTLTHNDTHDRMTHQYLHRWRRIVRQHVP
jgi:hypothetical protein